MFGSKTILIADASTYAAIDLADTIEACQGRVAGPVDTLAEALAILDSGGVAGAIVDCELDDAAALVLRLAERGVPLVMLTSTPLPPALDALERRLPVADAAGGRRHLDPEAGHRNGRQRAGLGRSTGARSCAATARIG